MPDYVGYRGGIAAGPGEDGQIAICAQLGFEAKSAHLDKRPLRRAKFANMINQLRTVDAAAAQVIYRELQALAAGHTTEPEQKGIAAGCALSWTPAVDRQLS